MTRPEPSFEDHDHEREKRQRAEQTLLHFVAQVERLNGYLERAIPLAEKALPILQGVSVQLGVSLKKMKAGGGAATEGLRDVKDLAAGIKDLFKTFK